MWSRRHHEVLCYNADWNDLSRHLLHKLKEHSPDKCVIQCSQLKWILATSWKYLYSEMPPKFCELQELKARDLETLKLPIKLLWDFGFRHVILWLSLYYKMVV